MFLTPFLGIIKYEGLHGIIYRVGQRFWGDKIIQQSDSLFNLFFCEVIKPHFLRQALPKKAISMFV